MSKSNKLCKRRLTVFGTISLIVVILFIYNLISYVSLINRLEKKQKELEKELVKLQIDIRDKKEEIEKLKNPDYLAKYARENFLYSKKGEYIIRIDENDNLVVEMNTDEANNKQKIVIFLLGITVLMIVIYLIIKVKKRSLE